jgi:hypothetical protein
MARTIAEIKKEITDDFIANPTVIEKYGLDTDKTFDQQFSRVSLENILFYLHAFRIWLLEALFDKHIEEANNIVKNKRPHTIGWYRATAMAFQFGKDLQDDISEYDNSDLTDEEITEQCIITKCAVDRADSVKPTLIVKVAKTDTYLNDVEKAAFAAYMDAKTDAGVCLNIVTGEPDRLWLSVLIRHDGLVVDSDGNRLVSSGNPVKETVANHLKNLVFNGTFYPSLLEQELMKLPGLKVATVQAAQAAPDGQTLMQLIDAYQPLTGALKIDVENDLIVEYEII